MATMATDPAMASQPSQLGPLVGRVRRWSPAENGDSGWGTVFSEVHNCGIFFDEEVVHGGTERLDGGHVLFRLSPDTARLSIAELWLATAGDILQAQEANRPLYQQHSLEGLAGITLATSEERSHPSRGGLRHPGPGGVVVRQFQATQGSTPNGAIGASVHGAVQNEVVQVPDGYVQQQQQQHPHQHQQQPHFGMLTGYQQQHQPHPGYAQGWQPAPLRQSPLSTVPVSRPQVAVLVVCPRSLSEEGWQEDYRTAANQVVTSLLQRQAMPRTSATVTPSGHFHPAGVQFAQALRQHEQQQQQREQQMRQMQQQMAPVMYDPNTQYPQYWWPAPQPQQVWMGVPQQTHGRQ
mmetsp:Transcript_29278/g.67418  ORF Transcript_29278/g.67418 Transcript_29278/m.67418 type:complete len:350 (+) Transcript_29278:54-1103(+)